MSRITVTEKFASLDFHSPTPQASPYSNKHSSPKSRAMSITHRVRAALDFTTSNDIYYKKSQEILSVANKAQDLKFYLKQSNSLDQNLINPRYLNQKITHMAKIVNANGMKDEQIFSGLTQRLCNRARGSRSANHNESWEISNFKRDNISQESINDPSKILLQKRYNQILYSENYLERLKDRYKKFQEKNDEIQKSLAKSIQKHWEELLLEKQKNAQKTVSNIVRILNGNEEEIALMRMTKAEIRMKNRMEKLHKRKYMSFWDKTGLPVLGHAYGLKNSDKLAKNNNGELEINQL